MKLLNLLKDAKSIAVDTAPFIYFIEENPIYIDIVEPLFQEISRGNLRAFTSQITLIEVLIKPLEEKNDDLIIKYIEISCPTPTICFCPMWIKRSPWRPPGCEPSTN